jgi:hypothetical protein
MNATKSIVNNLIKQVKQNNEKERDVKFVFKISLLMEQIKKIK